MRVRAFVGIVLLGLLASPTLAQSAAPEGRLVGASPSFVIADIHPSPHRSNPFFPGPFRSGDRYILRQATMLDLVTTAYGMDARNVKDGPSWLEWNRFDIIAKVPPGTSPDNLKLMLRSLLTDRFKLVVHNGTRPMPVYVLSVGAGKPNLKDSDGKQEPGCKYHSEPPNPQPGVPYDFAFSCNNTSMDQFVQSSLNWGQQDYMYSRAIINSTGLKGTYDFNIHWTGLGFLGRAGSEGTTVFAAVEKQLGLKLEPETTPQPVLIVDSADKPTPNSPDLEKILPTPPPPQFEVATVRPSNPDEMPGPGNPITRDRVNLISFPLKFAVMFAWDINQNDPDELVGAPKWMDSDHFDIVAKVSSESQTSAEQGGMPIEIDDLRDMLRALLIDRFQMKVHTEDRPIDSYAFVAANPKLKKADPSSRTWCMRGPGPDEKDPRFTNPTMNGLIHCQNVTLTQLGEQLRLFAPGYIHNPIFDATGLTGTWDLTLGWSSVDQVRAGGGVPQASGDASTPSDPNGAVSLFDAVPKFLGLKLEKQKRPMPVLVIDHVEEKPTEN